MNDWRAVRWGTSRRELVRGAAAAGGERPGLRFDQMEAAMRPIFTDVMSGKVSPKDAVTQLEQVAKPLLAELPAAAR